MALVTMNEVLKESVEKKYAVGAFDTMDRLFTESVLEAAEAKGVQVILMVVDFAFKNPGFDLFMEYIVDRCKKSTVPVALHLDHGSSFESVMKAIHYGCTSVMLDGSSLPFAENVALTKKVVEAAHACGISVEAEIGHVSGHEGNMLDGNVADENTFTTVEEAVRFYEETKVDCLAIAIGTVHGVYKGTPKLDLERLQNIRNSIPVPLVMHGGSGLPPEDFRNAIKHGINKVNFFTGMNIGAANAVKNYIDNNKKIQMIEILNVGSKAINEIVSEHLEIFGTLALQKGK